MRKSSFLVGAFFREVFSLTFFCNGMFDEIALTAHLMGESRYAVNSGDELCAAHMDSLLFLFALCYSCRHRYLDSTSENRAAAMSHSIPRLTVAPCAGRSRTDTNVRGVRLRRESRKAADI